MSNNARRRCFAKRSIDSMAHRLEIATCVTTFRCRGNFLDGRRENGTCLLLHTAMPTQVEGRFYELLPFADAAAACTSGDAEPLACPFEGSSAAFFSLSTTRWFRQ